MTRTSPRHAARRRSSWRRADRRRAGLAAGALTLALVGVAGFGASPNPVIDPAPPAGPARAAADDGGYHHSTARGRTISRLPALPSGGDGDQRGPDRAIEQAIETPAPELTPAPSPRSTTAAAPPSSAALAPPPQPAAAPDPAPTREPPAAPAPDPAPAPTAPNDDGAASEVLLLVNQYRAEAGCGPLQRDPALDRAATAHSADMRDRGYFDHTSPEGSDPGDRIAAAGGRVNGWAENIARGQPTAAAVVTTWMNGDGHRTNILNCSYRFTGIGVVHGDRGPWWTQLFGG